MGVGGFPSAMALAIFSGLNTVESSIKEIKLCNKRTILSCGRMEVTGERNREMV